MSEVILTENSPATSGNSLRAQKHAERLNKDEEEDDANDQDHTGHVSLSGSEAVLAVTGDEQTEESTRDTDVLEGGLPVGGDGVGAGFAVGNRYSELLLEGREGKEGQGDGSVVTVHDQGEGEDHSPEQSAPMVPHAVAEGHRLLGLDELESLSEEVGVDVGDDMPLGVDCADFFLCVRVHCVDCRVDEGSQWGPDLGYIGSTMSAVCRWTAN